MFSVIPNRRKLRASLLFSCNWNGPVKARDDDYLMYDLGDALESLEQGQRLVKLSRCWASELIQPIRRKSRVISRDPDSARRGRSRCFERRLCTNFMFPAS